MKRVLIALATLSLVGCVGPLISLFGPFFTPEARCGMTYRDDRYHDLGLDITNYMVPELHKSPAGVPIGPGVNGEHVDRAFQAIANCLGLEFRACAVKAVMIAPDWTVEPVTSTQVFPCNNPRASAKLCTGANQWPAVIIITPDEHALTWEVERMLLRDDPQNDGGRMCWMRKWLW